MKILSIMQQEPTLSVRSISDAGAGDILERLDVAVWIFDIDNSRITFANPAALELWKAPSAEKLYTRDLKSDMTPTVEKRLKQYQNDFSRSDATFTELWTIYPNGKPKSVMVVYRGYQLADGRMAMQCEAIGDVENQPDNLRSAEALLHTDVMITMFSMKGPPLYLNPAARNAFLAPIESFSGLFDNPADFERVIAHVETAGEHRLVTKLRTVQGKRWFDLSLKSCSDAVTGEPAILVTAIDVSELKEARDTARHLANRDQLTNLHNRSYLQNFLAQLEEEGAAIGSTIIFFDVDRFKLINDRYGHEAGDTVLKQIAERARAALRAQDMIARLGGDEFVVVIEGRCSRVALEKQIQRLRSAISAPILHDKTRIDSTISVGVAGYTDETKRFTDVLREADIALYASKQAGRNCVTFFNTEMGAAALARDQTEVALKRAVQTKEFILHYQPRLDIRSGKIVGAEGLVRWNRPEHGLVMPDAFISICEETGLIDELGKMVLEIGCAQAIAWRHAGLDLDLSLNVSPRQFSDSGFLPLLKKLASQTDFPHGHIELEITETVLIGDHVSIAEKLKAITAMGYRIAIDDFGTGYSNLSYISRFPLTCLKIDRSFVDQLPTSGPIVQLILTLGQQIGARVVSEGVETQEQLDWLIEHNCEEAQGYLITRPLDVDGFEAFLQGNAPTGVA
ncbi:diguanylate cyclase/phosphodiesterase [Octadecabacter temperatus]|uniref:Cyclic di-GMP phosphodiesterase Gmr n=1 Tax=Octadecabacter temperatus TaxID=1458307 RepID=A0A0K0Y6T6_9RHOB|nr:EAL domain-containing protein [Octadecabacter temperatus]AKS46630.1 Cyclic di-GMP phosphodiesterase Gmr [Octadecabacter temperatus]SIO18136.1 diguanylate cyclase/phosphodiesterase [Octadecabacter temperatus]